MKSYRYLAAAAALALLASCSGNKAVIDFTAPDAPETRMAVKQLNGTVTDVLDSVKTDARGHFSYKLDVAKGNPEFVYVYKADRRLASLLLESGEKAVVTADTLGNYEVSGSEGSILLKQGDDAFNAFMGKITALSNQGAEPAEIAREYIDHYRASVKFVLSNTKSLAVVPVLYENIGDSPVFMNVSDAMVFRKVCDSLKTVYPDSKYVKALETETVRREQIFALQNRINVAEERSYPNLNLPSVNGENVSLDSADAKFTLIFFWDAREATHKIFNLDVLKPLYAQYHSRGFEIYAVCVDPDKAEWAQVVKAQELPWINVNDGMGTASSSLYLYNVQSIPAAILVSENGIQPVGVTEKELRAAIAKGLK